jgi:Mlc titration factor MtfA (ptsG expression regulator)
MLKRLYRAWLQHVLLRSRIPYPLWHDCIASVPVLLSLYPQEQHRLRRLASLFLHEKTITGAGGLSVDSSMRVYIAAQACLLILNLDLDYFRGWSEVIVYPDTFVISREEYDSSGVVHETRRALAGEAWRRGPVILSWSDARAGASPHGPASNVILHEFAHKLDMLNGAANGMPPLHYGMVREEWTAALSQAYESLYHQVERNHHTAIDPYAAESPAEFFAVLTEVFFQQPDRLNHLYPDVYRQLRLYYRQDPLARISRQAAVERHNESKSFK